MHVHEYNIHVKVYEYEWKYITCKSKYECKSITCKDKYECKNRRVLHVRVLFLFIRM